MHIILRDKGSATVEFCLVAPIFLLMICMFIRVFLMTMNEGIVRGKGYVNIFSCDFCETETAVKERLEQIYVDGNGLPGARLIEASTDRGQIEMVISDKSQSRRLDFKLEDKAVDRMRRWQLYGDVLWE